MNQIKFWHFAGWNNYNCPTFRQSSFFSLETTNINKICGVGRNILISLYQLSLPDVLYTPIIFTI